MAFELSLPWLEAPLRRVLATQRGHAVLLTGPQGVGQFELALAVAQAWLCESPQEDKPCGSCASCALVRSRTHPDLLVLLPEALQVELGWNAADADAEPKASKTKPSREIKVEALRRAVEFAQQTSSRGGAKVVLVYPAQRMNAISANTLLKTLEEPPGRARFVLATEDAEALLPTIRSRCQQLPVTLPPADVALAWLQAQGLAGAEVLLAAAGGQPLTALEMGQQGADAQAWQQLPGRLLKGDAQALAGWSVPHAVQALHKLCHDAMCLAVGAAPRYFTPEALRGLSARLPELDAWSRELQRVARHEEHPWHAALMLESLVARAQRALN